MTADIKEALRVQLLNASIVAKLSAAPTKTLTKAEYDALATAALDSATKIAATA